jgi:hypothetical protein
LNLNNSEFHVHAFVLDVADYVQQSFELIDITHFSLELFFVVLGVFDDLLEFAAGLCLEDASAHVEPLNHLVDEGLSDFAVVNLDEIVLNVAALINKVSPLSLKEHDGRLDFLGTLILLEVFLSFELLVFVKELLHLVGLLRSLCEHFKTTEDLLLVTDDVDLQLDDHRIVHDVVIEGVRNVDFGTVIILLLFEDMTESSPPSSKLLGRIENVLRELLESGPQLFLSRVVCDFRVGVRAGHLDQIRLALSVKQGFVRGECSDGHLRDGIEDSSLPVFIVLFHFLDRNMLFFVGSLHS